MGSEERFFARVRPSGQKFYSCISSRMCLGIMFVFFLFWIWLRKTQTFQVAHSCSHLSSISAFGQCDAILSWHLTSARVWVWYQVYSHTPQPKTGSSGWPDSGALPFPTDASPPPPTPPKWRKGKSWVDRFLWAWQTHSILSVGDGLNAEPTWRRVTYVLRPDLPCPGLQGHF